MGMRAASNDDTANGAQSGEPTNDGEGESDGEGEGDNAESDAIGLDVAPDSNSLAAQDPADEVVDPEELEGEQMLLRGMEMEELDVSDDEEEGNTKEQRLSDEDWESSGSTSEEDG